MTDLFNPQVLNETLHWGRFLGSEWVRDMPDRMYESGLTPDGTPQRWTADLSRWMDGRPSSPDDPRPRTTRVMRKLRHAAPREYEVMYRALVLGEDFAAITSWLNDRAVRNAIPLPEGQTEHYRLKDAVALFIAGVEYARTYW